MATNSDTFPCCMCNKSTGTLFCTGCKQYFCRKDFIEHQQKQLTRFDIEVVESHNELLDAIHKQSTSNYTNLEIFGLIEQWKQISINKVQMAADKARQEIITLIERRKRIIMEELKTITKEIRSIREEESVFENDIDRLRTAIDLLRKKFQLLVEKEKINNVVVENNAIDWDRLLFVREPLGSGIPDVNSNEKWRQNGLTIAGGNGPYNALNQLSYPRGVCIADDQTFYVSELSNNRVMEWKFGATSGRVVAGGNGAGTGSNQLNKPTDIVVGKNRSFLIICDYGNRRVVRWPLHGGINGEIIVENIGCAGIAMDRDDAFLYVSDCEQHVVRRYRVDDSQGTVVAGGNGQGNRLDQLNNPSCIAVDWDRSLYVTDYNNHRVMKWVEGAKNGIVVAGYQGPGNGLQQLSYPGGITIDPFGAVYVADQSNHRIVRWPSNSTEGTIVIGGNGAGNQTNQLCSPSSVSFDREGNIYVSDFGNHRVQRFDIDRSS